MTLLKWIKVWNQWRKHNMNSKFYKLLVLLGITQSPTFRLMYVFYDVDATAGYRTGIIIKKERNDD